MKGRFMILRKYKDFGHLFLGRLISNCGDSIYTIVLSWYVLEMTNSAWYVGLLNFLIFIPNTFSFVLKYEEIYERNRYSLYP